MQPYPEHRIVSSYYHSIFDHKGQLHKREKLSQMLDRVLALQENQGRVPLNPLLRELDKIRSELDAI